LFKRNNDLRAENAIGDINRVGEYLSFHLLGVQIGLKVSRDIDQNQESSVADLFMILAGVETNFHREASLPWQST